MDKPTCPNCGAEAALVDSSVIYGRSYGWMWQCPNCPDHFVGCHKGRTTPMGTLAGPELRHLRKRCHMAFDQLWKGYPDPKRRRQWAYNWMAEVMGLFHDRAHIAMLTEQECYRLLTHLAMEHNIVVTREDVEAA